MGKQKLLLYALGLTGVLLSTVLVGGAMAADQQNVTQTYTNTGAVLHNGSIVRLKTGSKDEVVALEQANGRDKLGVVTPANDAPVSLTTPSDQRQVYVATTGQYNVLVSDQEGKVAPGDFITISALHGIGMKATVNDEVVIGKALGSFDGVTAVDGRSTVKTAGGGTRTVSIGHVRADITIAHNPSYKSTKVDGVPSFLAKAASVVTNKPVGALRIYAGLSIILACVLTSGFVIYAGVRNSMVAIGRNPLAKKSILRTLLQVVIISLIIFTIGIITVYLLLRL